MYVPMIMKKIWAVHNIHKVTRPIRQAQGAWNNVYIGFCSDIHEGHITSVVLPTQELFAAVPAVRVPLVGVTREHLDAVNQGMLRPLDPDDEDSELVSSRRIIPVPHAYVHLFLYRSLTPAEAWNQIGMQIVADGREQDCLVILRFLRMTMVNELGQRRNDPELLPQIAVIDDVVPPLGDAVFFGHLARKLCTLLPGATMAPTPNAVLQQVIYGQNLLRQTLQEATLETRAARLQEQETVEAPRSFSKAFPAQAAKIRALCDVGNEDEDLPEFWRMFARGKKSAGFGLLQEYVTTRACEPDSARVHLIVSANLYEQLSRFTIGSLDQEDLRSGLSPFLMCPVGYHKAAAQRELNEQYSLIADGVAPTLADSVKILPATYNIPTTISSLVDFIGSYSVLLDVLLGVEHPLATRLREHHQFWDCNKSSVESALMTEYHGMAICNTLRYLQITCLSYSKEKMYMPTAVFPDFNRLEENIRFRTFGNLPSMPAEFLYQQAQAMQAHQQSVQQSQRRQTPPSATAPASSERQGNPVDAPEGERVKAWLERYVAKKKSLYTLRTDAGNDMPKVPDGSKQLCLSYHLRGQCFNICRNRSTHRKLTPTETTTFQAFVDKYL
jgi:hypothetical protein